jgi:threonylcarbamoyladenosine tRNA methylthiotransferase MtaB
VGSAQSVLIENKAKGHTDSFAPVTIAGARRGELGQVHVTGREGDLLVGSWA